MSALQAPHGAVGQERDDEELVRIACRNETLRQVHTTQDNG